MFRYLRSCRGIQLSEPVRRNNGRDHEDVKELDDQPWNKENGDFYGYERI